MSAWSPYIVARTDLPVAVIMHKTYKLDIALSLLRFQNRHFPEHVYVIVHDGGILNEVEAEELLNRQATDKFKIVGRAA